MIVLTHEHREEIMEFSLALVNHDRAYGAFGNHQLYQVLFGPSSHILREYYEQRVEEEVECLVRVTLDLVLLWDQYTPVR